MARHYGEGPLLLKDIAERQQISLRYLEHLIGPLVGAGLVKTTRGFKGGVWLARPPAEIKLSEAMQLLEGDITPVECIKKSGRLYALPDVRYAGRLGRDETGHIRVSDQPRLKTW